MAKWDVYLHDGTKLQIEAKAWRGGNGGLLFYDRELLANEPSPAPIAWIPQPAAVVPAGPAKKAASE